MFYNDHEHNHTYDTFNQVLIDEKEKEEKYKLGFSMLDESAKSGYLPSMIYKLIYIPSDENQLREAVDDFLNYVFRQNQSEIELHFSEHYYKQVCDYISKIVGDQYDEKRFIEWPERVKEIRFNSIILPRFFDFSRQQQQSIMELMYAPCGPEYMKAQSQWNTLINEKNPNL